MKIFKMSGSRPLSITRSLRDSFTPEMECLPPEIEIDSFDIDFCEEIEDFQNVEAKGNKNEAKPNSKDSSKKEGGNKSRSKSSKSSSSSKSKTRTADENDVIDPKIRKGLKKIHKLDQILQTRFEQEREVKKERLELERTFLKQVQTLVEEKGAKNVVGYQQLLSLCAATDREEIIIDEALDDDTVQSIFSTQIDDSNFRNQELDKKCTDEQLREILSRGSNNDNKNTSEKTSGQKQKKSKDFIKRNIKLASLASETIALTDDEKHRLEELLTNDNDLLIGKNPFSIPSITVGGFSFTTEERKTMDDIDEKLKEYIPVEEYEAILNQSLSSASLSEKSVKSNSASTGLDNEYTRACDVTENLQEVECGEEMLREEHQKRTTLQRLNDIERKLRELRTITDDTSEELEATSVIDRDLIRQLLDTNSRLTSTSKSICESFRTNSILYDNMDDIDVCSIASQSLTLTSVDDDKEITPAIDS